MLENSEARSYRTRIYGSYVSAFKGRPAPADLEREFLHHGRSFDHLLGGLVERLAPRKALEVGCGQGRFMFWAVRRGIPDVRGFDAADEQVAVAASLGLHVEVATASDYLTRCDRDFDMVVAIDVVEHFARDEAFVFLEQCRQCLRPGGVLFLTTPNGAGLRPGPVMHGDLTHETIFTPSTIALALRLCGFEEPRVSEIVPPPTGIKSRLRRALWRMVRLAPAALDLIEKGSSATHVYSRVMAVEARATTPD